MFKLKFKNDWLFKKKKQPWAKFRNILIANGFPEEMTLNHVRKKWSYTYDSYKLAKKINNRSWRYFKLFDKHYGKNKALDKYESWNDEWRLKLITCMSDAKEHNLDLKFTWRMVERAMRSQALPNDCCIQDIKRLWQHIIMVFNRKHRLALKKGAELTNWPLYDVMLNYFKKYDPQYLYRVETEPIEYFSRQRKSSENYFRKGQDVDTNEYISEFQWSKHITEMFIQIRFQYDWLFREKKWAWNDLLAILIKEHGFPKSLNSRDISRKWSSTYAEYQKAKATDNKSWVYYNLFELYMGERSLSLNPLSGWREEWVYNLIRARTELEHLFQSNTLRDKNESWREVEKQLRNKGVPLDHSLLDIQEIWSHLLKTFRWKRKFADKGILNEHWPYYNAMAQYTEVITNYQIKIEKQEMENENYAGEDDIEEDMKLFDLKQRLQALVEPKRDGISQCRCCSNEEGCINIFENRGNDGPDLVEKLKIIGGIEIESTDKLPSQICPSCLQELESAYKFRRRCQETDKNLRNSNFTDQLKIEVKVDDHSVNNNDDQDQHIGAEFDDMDYNLDLPSGEEEKKKNSIQFKIKRKKRKEYHYWNVCEVCGKPTRNLKSHLDMHTSSKEYTCEVCDKKFKFKSGLIIHKAKHDPVPKKTCEICGKTFHIVAQYRRHYVYHANERKHECATCGKRFNTLDILRVHKMMHTDERPYSCSECGKMFRTAGCVSRHKRIVHKNKMKVE